MPARAVEASRPIRALLQGFGLLLLYTAPTLVYLRPVWRRLGGFLPGVTEDPLFNLYVLKWSAHQLRLGLPDLWDANIFYPVRGTLAFSDHLLGPALQLLVLLDLHLVPNAIAGYNLLLVSSFVLSGAATCWVLRQSGRSWTASVLGGFMYAFAPMRWAQLEHLQVLLAQWVPLTLWAWDRLLAEASWKRAAVFLPLYLLHLTGGCYLAYMIHVPMLALLASRGAADWRRLVRWHSLQVLLAVALPAAAAGFLLFEPYLEVSHRYGLVRRPDEVALYSATLLSYLAPSESNLYGGWWQKLADRAGVDVSRDEGRLFAGFAATAFCAYGVLLFYRRYRAPPVRPSTAWQRAAAGALLALTALSFVWGDVRTLQAIPPADAWNGPALGFGLGAGLWLLARRRWGGNGLLRWAAMDPWERGLVLGGVLCLLLSFPIAFVPLMRVVPGLASLRAPGQFHVMTSLVVVYFAALGLDEWLPRMSGRRLAVGAALAVVLAVELAPAPVAWRSLRDEPEFRAVYRYLRSAQQVRAVLELPMLRKGHEARYMYYSTLHWKPLANGYSGHIPDSYLELREKIPLLPDRPGFALLRSRAITHLVVHTGGLDGRALRERLPAWEREFLGREVERVFDEEGDQVYRLLGQAAAERAEGTPVIGGNPPLSRAGWASAPAAGRSPQARPA
ncbi:MAG: hypothetical protein M3O15_07680 [Acidobacteriota bacterium]|nr:hypothetical protein [Acidobacteriota bacterium]